MSKLLPASGCGLLVSLVAIGSLATAQEPATKDWAAIASILDAGDSATTQLEHRVDEFIERLKQRKFVEATADFESLVKAHWSDSFQNYLAKRLHQKISSQELRISLKLATSADAQDPALQRLQGYILFLNDEGEKDVHERLDRAIKLDATNPVAFFIRGRCDRFSSFYNTLARNRLFHGAFAEETAKSVADISDAIRLDQTSACFYLRRAELNGIYQGNKIALDDIAAAMKLNHDPFECLLIRGQIHASMGDDRAAIDDFNEAIEVYKRQMIESGRAAFVHYNLLISVDPPLAKCFFERGRSKAELKDYRSAIDDFNAALDRSKYLGQELFENRALMYIAIKDYPAAIADINKAGSFFGHLERRAWVKLQLKDYQGALNDYDESLKRYSEDSDALVGRGITKHRMGDTDGAMVDLNKACDLVGLFKVEPSIARGMLYLDLKDPQKAILDFDQALEVDSQNVGAYFQRALANHALKRYASAIDDFNTVLRHDPDNVGALFNRGLAQRGSVDYSDAIASFDAVIKLDPKHIRSYYSRGLTKHDIGDDTGAIVDYDTAIGIDPKYTNAYIQRAWAKTVLSEFKLALADFDSAIELDNNSLKAITGKCFILSTCSDESLRNATAAGDLATAAADIDAEDPAVLNARACADAAAGNFTSAIDLEQKALKFSRFATSDDLDGGQYASARIDAWKSNRLWTIPAAK